VVVATMNENGLQLLENYLEQIAAQLLWELPIERVGVIKAYSANGRFLILHEMEGGGWKVLTPITDSLPFGVSIYTVRAYCQPHSPNEAPYADGLREAFNRFDKRHTSGAIHGFEANGEGGK